MDQSQISLNQFLETFFEGMPLAPAERDILGRARHSADTASAYHWAGELIHKLVHRNILQVLEHRRGPDGASELLIRDPARRARARLAFPLASGAAPPATGEADSSRLSTRQPTTDEPATREPVPRPEPGHREHPDRAPGTAFQEPSSPARAGSGDSIRRIPLPLPVELRSGIRFEHVQELLSTESGLVAHDRVTTPREVTARLGFLLSSLWNDVQPSFHPVVMPPGDVWPGFDSGLFPVVVPDLQRLAQQRDHVIVTAGTDGRPPLLLVGMGDDLLGWSAILGLARDPSPGVEPLPFDDERISLVTLVATHFQSLLSNVFRLQGLIFYDYLTGIYNRAFFEEQLERELRLSRRRGQSLALLIVDIDDFKAFNTRYGYDGGDRALATVACVLKSLLRATDTLARYGGEEFAIILAPPIPADEARTIAERLRHAVEQEPFQLTDLEGRRVEQRITVSIGGALFPDSGSTPRDLWVAANRQVLTAKASGKNRVHFSDTAH